MLPGHCPSEVELGQYAAGDLPDALAETINTHVGRCADCLGRLDGLAALVDPLVAALRQPGGGVASTPAPLARAVAAVLGGADAPPAPGAELNGYRIIEELGRGGMGRVYRAAHPRLEQEVALKVLRPGLDSAPVLARFEAERQALARMDHPNIARVFDGGVMGGNPKSEARNPNEDADRVSDFGFRASDFCPARPYIVMELVKGVPITRYCADRRLDLRRRLGLFADVCRAVQHAHQKGVIHRDIKPSNVLVAEYDGTPAVKVIDFGVARPIERLAAGPTEAGMLVGTPAYMSPEQAALTGQDIDTRTDVYALGVLLYELLTGTTPFGPRLRGAPVLEVLRVIREEEPPAPSARGGGPAGELDWIALKALEKDRDRRYDTAAALAEDVRHYLNDEPVQAGPPSRTYRLKKFVRRNRGSVLAAAAVLLALVGGIVGTSVGLVRADAARENAATERDQKQLALEAEQLARGEATRAGQQALTALRTMTNGAIERLMARQTTLTADDRDFLLKVLAEYEALAALRGAGEESRAIRAEGHYRVGFLRQKLGERPAALAAYDQAQELYQDLIADFPAVAAYRKDLAETVIGRAILLRDLNRRPEAEAEYGRAAEIYGALVAADPAADLYRVGWANCLNNLAVLLHEMGRPDEAETAYGSSVVHYRQLAADHPKVTQYRKLHARSHVNLGILLEGRKKYDAAIAEYREGIRLHKELAGAFPASPDHRADLADSYHNLGALLSNLNRGTEGAIETRHALALRKQLAAEFPAVPVYRRSLALSHNSLAITLRRLRKRPEAEQEQQAALVLQRRLASDYPAAVDYAVDLAGSCCNMGAQVRDDGRPAEALDWFGQAIATLTPVANAKGRTVVARLFLRNSHFGRAATLMMLDRFADAVGDWDRALELDDGSGRTHYRVQRALCLARIEPARAVAEAEELTADPKAAAATLYGAAAACSLAAHGTDDGERTAAKAVALLDRAATRGYFGTAAGRKQLTADPALDPLRPRPDFQKLLTELGLPPQKASGRSRTRQRRPPGRCGRPGGRR